MNAWVWKLVLILFIGVAFMQIKHCADNDNRAFEKCIPKCKPGIPLYAQREGELCYCDMRYQTREAK